mgnify:CR=1 FL=1
MDLKLNFKNKHYAGEQGWQYTSSGSVNGIKGRVDLNCFSSKFYNKPVSENVPVAVSDALTRAGVRFFWRILIRNAGRYKS